MTRKNSLSGVHYFDEPAIFAWELMNEPRCSLSSSSSVLQVNHRFYFSFNSELIPFHDLLRGSQKERLLEDMTICHIFSFYSMLKKIINYCCFPSSSPCIKTFRVLTIIKLISSSLMILFHCYRENSQI